MKLRTRWRNFRDHEWRIGLVRYEWWVGTRWNLQADAREINIFGLMFVWRHR